MTQLVDEKIRSLMLVDDNDLDQRLYARLIKRSAVIDRFTQFLDPAEAIADLQNPATEMPDLVLLDINMPGMDGFEFLDTVTNALGERMCPVVVMLTTSLNPQDERRARNYAVVRNFFNKPLTEALLRQLAN